MQKDLSILEKEVTKSVQTRERISKLLTRNFPVDKDLADLIALSATNQAMGLENVTEYLEVLEYKKNRELAEQERLAEVEKKKARKQRWANFKWRYLNFDTIAGLVVVVVVMAGISTAIYFATTHNPYPRTYKALPETVRFSPKEISFREPSTIGLNDRSNLCIANYSSQTDRYGEGSGVSCIHENKLASLTQAMDKAVQEDFNGVIWNEANGRGENWLVERNNYRFVITATKDTDFKD